MKLLYVRCVTLVYICFNFLLPFFGKNLIVSLLLFISVCGAFTLKGNPDLFNYKELFKYTRLNQSKNNEL